MFSAFDSIFTPENLLFLLKGAMTSLGIAALSLLIGFVITDYDYFQCSPNYYY